MYDLVKKRHAGPGWQVFSELANGTGSRVRGWADAAAFGIWPSRGYELHGYEFKISRSDLQRELNDPTKADNIGKYCHYWWLCLERAEIMEGLAIPDAWGILVPSNSGKNAIFKTIRKAPKVKDPRPFDPGFVAAIIRNVTKNWVTKDEHKALEDNIEAEVAKRLEDALKSRHDDASWQLKHLRATVESFTQLTGIDLEKVRDWEVRDLADTVNVVRRAREAAGIGRHSFKREARDILKGEIATLRRGLEGYDRAKAATVGAANALEEFLAGMAEEADDEVQDSSTETTH